MATRSTSGPGSVAAGGARGRRNPAAPWRHIDIIVILATLLAAGFGVLMVYSATRYRDDPLNLGRNVFFLQRQAIFAVIGVAVMIVVSAVDYRVLRDFALFLYVGTVLAVAGVLVLGPSSHGAQAWYQLGPFQFQPSEFAKVALIVCLAGYCASHHEDFTLGNLVTVLGLAALPMALIQLQPDLGTNLVFAFILLGMLLVAGVRARHMAVLLALGVVGVVAVVQLGVLQKYQTDRLTSFVNPSADVRGSTYNQDQSKTTIGDRKSVV